MRHRVKRNHLGKASDQRKALLRSLVTALFMHDQIQTTQVRAKVMTPLVHKIVSWAKRGDLNSIRQIARVIYHRRTGEMIEDKNGRMIEETVLRRILRTVGPRFTNRPGGYTRLVATPPRKGDAAPMAIIEFVS